jgi:peptidyl-tRNA hydrolase
MKQVIFILKQQGRDHASLAAQMALQGLVGRCRASGSKLVMDGEVFDWVQNSPEVEIVLVSDAKAINAIAEKAESTLLCPTIRYGDENRQQVQAVALGPFRQGLFNSVFGDITRF